VSLAAADDVSAARRPLVDIDTLLNWSPRSVACNKQKPFRLIGPTGTVALMQNLERADADDMREKFSEPLAFGTDLMHSTSEKTR